MDLDEALAEPEVQPSSLAHELRDYQFAADIRIEEGWRAGHQTQLFVIPTGGGKTRVMAAAAMRNYEAGGRTLFLCHMDELIEQARKEFTNLTKLPTAKEKAAEHALLSDRVVMGSIQTMAKPNRLATWPKNHFSLVIGDEAHLHLAKGWLAVLNHFREGGARILGCTATAERGDKKELGTFYQNLAYDYSLVNAVHDGWLVRPMVQTINIGEGIDIREVKAVRTGEGSDLNPTQIGHIIEPFLKRIAAHVWEQVPTRKILIFMPSIDTAQKMAEAMKAMGFMADWVSGTDDDRRVKLARYMRNELRVLCCPIFLSTGWDCDDLDVIMSLRATKVRTLYRQIVGRGTRPLKVILKALQAAANAEERKKIIAASAKPSLLLLDPLWLYENHDLTTPACLVAKNEDEEKALKGKQGDLIAAEETVAKDLLDNLRKAVEKNRNRKSSFIDPLTFAVAMDDETIANYNPETLWQCDEPTAGQIKALEANGVESSTVRWRGQAEMILNVINSRNDRGLCTVRQMNFLKKHQIDARLMDKDSATKKVASIILNFKHHHYRK